MAEQGTHKPWVSGSIPLAANSLLMKTLISQVEATLQKNKMLRPSERILVACSGGADSVALFHFLREAFRGRIRLGLIHFDHGLRPASRRDFKFVRSLAKKFKVPFYGERQKPGRPSSEARLSPEEKARESRYRFFEKIAKKTGVQKIALAHHRDDQAETVLMRVIQGTGLRGLQGMRPQVQLKGVTYIRPLIEVGKSELRAFLKKHSFSYREDATNRSLRFFRNRIRLRLLPWLEKEFNPRIRESLSRLAETARAESSGLDEWIRKSWKTCLTSRRNGTVWLERERFLSLPGFLQFRLLEKALQFLEPRSGIDFQTWKRIESKLPLGRLRMSLAGNLDLNLTPKKLFIRKSDTMAAERRKKYPN